MFSDSTKGLMAEIDSKSNLPVHCMNFVKRGGQRRIYLRK